jgi:DNA-directed RNA polymerase subunit RPC12/RpoP
MAIDIDAHRIELTCPHCGHKLSETIGRLKTNPHLVCPACRGGIDIQADQLRAAFEKVKRALAHFGRKRGGI